MQQNSHKYSVGDMVVVKAVKRCDYDTKRIYLEPSDSPNHGSEEFPAEIAGIIRESNSIGANAVGDILVTYDEGWQLDNEYVEGNLLPESTKYVGKMVWSIPSVNIIRMAGPIGSNRTSDGEFCIECNDFYKYAEKNHKLGLICWSCRDSVGWKYR